MNFEQLSNDVLVWANEKGILKPENHLKQMGKMVSEVGELCDEIIKDNYLEQEKELGDVLVTVIILAEQLGLSPINCLDIAYNKIKNRTGTNVNGTFIKDTVNR